MKNRFIQMFLVICAVTLMICAVSVWAAAENAIATPTDLEPVEQEESVPETTEPETTEPETVEPEETEPEETEPEEAEPEATEPEVTEPQAAEVETTLFAVVLCPRSGRRRRRTGFQRNRQFHEKSGRRQPGYLQGGADSRPIRPGGQTEASS